MGDVNFNYDGVVCFHISYENVVLSVVEYTYKDHCLAIVLFFKMGIPIGEFICWDGIK